MLVNRLLLKVTVTVTSNSNYTMFIFVHLYKHNYQGFSLLQKSIILLTCAILFLLYVLKNESINKIISNYQKVFLINFKFFLVVIYI